MKKIILYLLLDGTLPLLAQNLIYNGDLSSHTHTDCPFPYVGLSKLPNWYSVGNSTVDYYLSHCTYLPPPGLDFNPFFNYNSGRLGFIGFWAAFKRNFTMVSEAFATPLTQPLRSDMGYFLSIDVRSRGKGHPLEGVNPLYCPTDPKMQFDIYTHSGVITGNLDGSGDVTHLNANKVLSIDILALVDTLVSETWTNMTGCFQAIGGETHIGFAMALDSFLPVPPCDAPYNPADLMQEFGFLYFNVDNFQLLSFPLTVTDTVLLCKERTKVEIDAAKYFESFQLADFQPSWDDGLTNTIRTFTEGGWQHHWLHHRCGSTEFQIYVDEKRCEAMTYMPSAFSPNHDGINDGFHPFIAADFPVANFDFMVFDRWGNNLYRSTNNDGLTGWDGRFRGKEVSQGEYVWTLAFDLVLPNGIKPYQLAGDVLLVR